MPRTPITRAMLKKHKGNLRKYYLEEGKMASERAANAPGSYSDIPKSDIRSMTIADRLYNPVETTEIPGKKKKKPTFYKTGKAIQGLVKARFDEINKIR